jgi:uncharacterized Zn-finger protein
MADDAVELVDHRFRCPGCDEEVDVSAEVVGQLVRCPYCNTEFFADAARSGDVVVDDTPAPVEDAPPAGELNALRISQLTALRQATLRVRSWWVSGVFLAVITAVDLTVRAGRYVAHMHGWGIRPTLFSIVALAAVAVAAHAGRQARRLGDEASRSRLEDPDVEPDFSTLGDGSDRWRHLDEIR